MSLCGYSLDNLSLMALTIATGFVVDDAIIMIENIIRRMANGETALDAAIGGVRQMAFTVISITARWSRLDPDPVHARHRRPLFSRIRHHSGGGDRLLRGGVIDADAMLCGHLLGRRKSGSADAAGMGSRMLVPESAPLRPQSRLDAAASDRDHDPYADSDRACVWLYLILPKGFMPTQDTGVMFVRTIARPTFPSRDGGSAARRRRSDPRDPRSPASLLYREGNAARSARQMLVASSPEQRKLRSSK